jgi:hypothetical protein
MGRPEDVDVSDIHHALITSGVVTPVVLGGTEERSWADCDLASLAENRLADATDPGNIDEECREEWRRRATTAPCGLPSQRRFEACFWLLEGTERVGTVALASSLIGSRLLGLSSLYVFRSQRRKGVGTRALGRLRQILSASGLGIRLETSWAWQPAVHFYYFSITARWCWRKRRI